MDTGGAATAPDDYESPPRHDDAVEYSGERQVQELEPPEPRKDGDAEKEWESVLGRFLETWMAELSLRRR
jgi:hypothetical protein